MDSSIQLKHNAPVCYWVRTTPDGLGLEKRHGHVVVSRTYRQPQIDIMSKRAQRWMRNNPKPKKMPPQHIDRAIAILNRHDPKAFAELARPMLSTEMGSKIIKGVV